MLAELDGQPHERRDSDGGYADQEALGPKGQCTVRSAEVGGKLADPTHTSHQPTGFLSYKGYLFILLELLDLEIKC